MVVAKNDVAHQELARQFHDREVEKEYVALVWGRGAGRTPHRRADRTRSVEPPEDVDASAPCAERRDARHARRALEGRIAAQRRDRHRPHAPDSRASERDRPSDRRRSDLRRRPSARGRRCARRAAAGAAVPARRAPGRSRIRPTAGGWISNRRCPPTCSRSRRHLRERAEAQ